jgi:NADH:ubiquinone oxidoreductase subunit 6 (subunit J)
MIRKLKKIGLGAAIILFLAGLVVMSLGFGIINEETTDPSGIELFFNFLGGGFLVLLGGGVLAVMLTILVVMGFVEIGNRSGTKGFLIGAGALLLICVLIFWSIFQWSSNLVQP